MTLKVSWVDRGYEPKCSPDPRYPEGIDLDLSKGATFTCETKLTPYPTPRCGLFAISCDRCAQRIIITTAGRPDDPRSIKLACVGRKS
jgi:hypothetical protein